jgi:uncharacterized protein YigA (DUF484 family)
MEEAKTSSFFMDQDVEMYLKTSDFYIKESTRLIEKSKLAKTTKEKVAIVHELQALRSRIIREINEIEKICEDNSGNYQ